jgi:hypothetical protein
MRVAFYTSGEIGGGHLARALAVKRGLERRGSACTFRVFYSRLPLRPPPELDITVLTTPIAALRDEALAKTSDVARALRDFAPELLLVDLAWRDLSHILPLPGVEAWLLLRWCPPEYLRGPFNRAFRPELYTRIVGIEPTVRVEVTDRIDPVVVCNPDECRSRAELRARFGLAADAAVTFIVQAGLPGECDELVRYERERGSGHALVIASLHDPEPLFPVAPWLPGADRIVGGAGYNLFWETHWLGLRARTELHAFRRGIDDQTPRLNLTPSYAMKENGADTLARWIAGDARR